MAADRGGVPPFSLAEAAPLFEKTCPALATQPAIAVGVSGGPDSLALAWLLHEYAAAQESPLHIHALTVDHGLREGAAAEAKNVAACMAGWPSVTHRILHWQGPKPQTCIQEAARRARYRLMAAYCAAHEISYLFLAHHEDDQMETFLFRLAKGSGLDGLGVMKPLQAYGASLMLARPFLEAPKNRLVATCEAAGLSYANDSSNDSDMYFRPRLRKTMQFLKNEGLSAKRLNATARRLDRARRALDDMAENFFQEAVLEQTKNHIIYKYEPFRNCAEEVALRGLIKGFQILRAKDAALPRLEKIEAVFQDLNASEPFRKRTLGGVIVERNDDIKIIKLSREK